MVRYVRQDSVLGSLVLGEEDGRIVLLGFGEKDVPKAGQEAETPVLAQARAQLDAYFAGERKAFELPLNPVGTEFQRRVWEALCGIPYGETRSYGQVAASLGKPGAARAVGMANNRNPISIIIPCHRVIGANGALVGYGGGLDIKIKLLEIEGYISHSGGADSSVFSF